MCDTVTYSKVIDEHLLPDKSLSANVTNVRRFFSRVKPPVLLQVVAFGKSSLAERANVRLFPRVNSQVPFETSAGSKGERASFANVRPTARVNGRMFGEPGRRPKTLSAVLAKVRFLSRVNSLVSDQCEFPRETFPARVAQVRFLSVVHHHVQFELPSLNTFTAHFAVDKLRLQDSVSLWRFHDLLFWYFWRLWYFDFGYTDGRLVFDSRNFQRLRFFHAGFLIGDFLTITALDFYFVLN